MPIKVYFISVSQDGQEFSSPKIHTPFYKIDDSCNPYARDDKLFLETFQKHFRQEVTEGARARSSAIVIWPAAAAWLLLLLLIIL